METVEQTKEMRRVELFVDGQWNEVDSFQTIKAGDKFRAFDAPDRPVVMDGRSEFVAKKDAFYSDEAEEWCTEIERPAEIVESEISNGV